VFGRGRTAKDDVPLPDDSLLLAMVRESTYDEYAPDNTPSVRVPSPLSDAQLPSVATFLAAASTAPVVAVVDVPTIDAPPAANSNAAQGVCWGPSILDVFRLSDASASTTLRVRADALAGPALRPTLAGFATLSGRIGAIAMFGDGSRVAVALSAGACTPGGSAFAIHTYHVPPKAAPPQAMRAGPAMDTTSLAPWKLFGAKPAFACTAMAVGVHGALFALVRSGPGTPVSLHIWDAATGARVRWKGAEDYDPKYTSRTLLAASTQERVLFAVDRETGARARVAFDAEWRVAAVTHTLPPFVVTGDWALQYVGGGRDELLTAGAAPYIHALAERSPANALRVSLEGIAEDTDARGIMLAPKEIYRARTRNALGSPRVFVATTAARRYIVLRRLQAGAGDGPVASFEVIASDLPA
jgi:hypothetical protein